MPTFYVLSLRVFWIGLNWMYFFIYYKVCDSFYVLCYWYYSLITYTYPLSSLFYSNNLNIVPCINLAFSTNMDYFSSINTRKLLTYTNLFLMFTKFILKLFYTKSILFLFSLNDSWYECTCCRSRLGLWLCLGVDNVFISCILYTVTCKMSGSLCAGRSWWRVTCGFYIHFMG